MCDVIYVQPELNTETDREGKETQNICSDDTVVKKCGTE